MNSEQSAIEQKLLGLRKKIQLLNCRRQAVGNTAEVKLHYETANHIFLEMLRQVEATPPRYKKPVEDLTVQLIELSDSSKHRRLDEMATAMDSLDNDIDRIGKEMSAEIHAIKQHALQHMIMVLSNCLDEGRTVNGALTPSEWSTKINEKQADEVKELQEKLRAGMRLIEVEEAKWAQKIMTLEAELEAVRRHHLKQAHAAEKRIEELSKRLEEAEYASTKQSEELTLTKKSMVIPSRIMTPSDRVWILEVLAKAIGSPVKLACLLFDDSSNEFPDQKFHKLCDGERNLLLIAKSVGGVFGGFVDQPYGSEVASDKCFLFNSASKQVGTLDEQHGTTAIDKDGGFAIGGKHGFQIKGSIAYSVVEASTLKFQPGADPIQSSHFPLEAGQAELEEYEVYTLLFE